MLRFPFVTALLVLITSFAAAVSSPPERKERDSATQLKALTEEVRLLRQRVTQLENQVAELQALSRHATLPLIEFQPMPSTIVPGQPLIWEPPLKGELPPIELPSIKLPSTEALPWNYDQGLYVFPGWDAPANGPKANKQPQSPASPDHLR